MYLWVSKDAPSDVINNIFGVPHFRAIPESMVRTIVVINMERLPKIVTCVY